MFLWQGDYKIPNLIFKISNNFVKPKFQISISRDFNVQFTFYAPGQM